MNSNFLKLKKVDFWKGLVLAVLTGLVNSLYQILSNSTSFSEINWQAAIIAAGTAFVGYIIKNFFSNENGEFLKK